MFVTQWAGKCLGVFVLPLKVVHADARDLLETRAAAPLGERPDVVYPNICSNDKQQYYM